MDLLEALRRPESKTLEFKRDMSSPEGLLRTVVAFANTAGGTILVGVEDGTGNVRGVADPLALEERLANLITDSIAPRLLPDLEILTYRKTQVVAVQVYPSPARPHHLVRSGVQAGTYVRVGSTNRRADAELIAEMQRFALGQAFDEGPMPGLDSEAIDFRAASESFAEVRSLRKRDLATLRLVTEHQGRRVPTAGGVLLFGIDRLRHFPDAWIHQRDSVRGKSPTRSGSLHAPRALDSQPWWRKGWCARSVPARRIPNAAISRQKLHESALA
jgi:predicted HTH transcriptional regulator